MAHFTEACKSSSDVNTDHNLRLVHHKETHKPENNVSEQKLDFFSGKKLKGTNSVRLL